ncbi:MAG: hypothetical protein NT027_02090 [Proteobacteria bacterium]|nr:hypothetical protein [Pseudomonadota bacterium]
MIKNNLFSKCIPFLLPLLNTGCGSSGGSGSGTSSPTFNLSTCSATEETFTTAVKVSSTVEGTSIAFDCTASQVNADRLGTSSTYLAYNVICQNTTDSSRLSFWIKGFTAGVPFTFQPSWDSMPNLSFLLETPKGKLQRGSLSSDTIHATSIGGVVWTYTNPTVPDVGTQPEHRIKGCLEGVFEAKSGFAAGTAKVLFDVTMK